MKRRLMRLPEQQGSFYAFAAYFAYLAVLARRARSDIDYLPRLRLYIYAQLGLGIGATVGRPRTMHKYKGNLSTAGQLVEKPHTDYICSICKEPPLASASGGVSLFRYLRGEGVNRVTGKDV